jgi:hypothetical protein
MDINEFCDEIIDIYKQIIKPLMICLMGIVEIEEGLKKLQSAKIPT